MSSLQGVRVQISGAVPDDASEQQRLHIRSFTTELCAGILREGGYLVHGSHPTLAAAIRSAAAPFIASGGPRDAITAVRARKYTLSPEHRAEVAEQRKYCVVQIVPYPIGSPNQSLLPLRDWIADRSDAVVAFGGRHWQVNRERSGVPKELEAALSRGHPGFLSTVLGGAVSGYAEIHPHIYSRLRNGLSARDNRILAEEVDPQKAARRIIEQLARLPLGTTSERNRGRYRILALDGGGLRGVFTAAVLAQWDEMLGPEFEIARHFDLIAGTSTGAILALGLGLGLPPSRILTLYREVGPTVFKAGRPWAGWFSPKFKGADLRRGLDECFGDKTLSDSLNRLVLPSVRAQHGKPEVFTTPHHVERTAFARAKAVGVAVASSAAPTFFDQAEIDSGVVLEQFIDGGIWANNPVIPALSEAIRFLDMPIECIDVLSLGTVDHEVDLQGVVGGGRAQVAFAVADLFMAAQQHASLLAAQKLLGHSRFFRVNQSSSHEIPLDSVKDIDELARRGAQEGRDTFDQVRSRFLDGCYADVWRSSS